MVIIWCMVSEIWIATDIIFCHSGRFSKFQKNGKAPDNIIILQMCSINDSHMMYSSWDIECDEHFFFVILNHFLPFFYPLANPKKNVLRNWKKAWRYYNFTHVCHKWQLYDVWFLRYQVWQAESFVILDHFCTPRNQKFFERNPLEISSFYTNGSKIMIICYTILEKQCMTDFIFIFYFGPFKNPKN